MSVSRRLKRLEERDRSACEEAEERTRSAESREVLRRLSDPELEAYGGALRRLKAESAPLGEDWAIRDRVTQLYEEVRNDKRLRIERLEATQSTTAGHDETPMYLELYFKHLENERRKQAREPPIPLTPEEERWERERDEDPEFRAYLKRISEQREEQH